MDLTVAICTYRRPKMLEQTLASLAACEPIDAAWELLVIDNECNDEVKRIVEGYADKMARIVTQLGVRSTERSAEPSRPETRNSKPETRVPVRYIPEPTTGTSHARNRAINEAGSPVVLFTDDDVTFEPAWLKRMWLAISTQGDCRFWGGRVEPVWSQPKPKWFDEGQNAMLGDTIVQYQRGEKPRLWDAKNDPPFYTANLALRVDAVREAGMFDVTVGHAGKRRMGMEDSLMVRAVSGAGGKGWYVADAIVNHPVPDDRMKRSYGRRFAWRQGWLSAMMTRRRDDEGFGTKGKLPKWFFRVAIGELFKGIGQTLAGFFTFNSGKRFGGSVRVIFNCSRLWHGLFSRAGSE